MPATATFQVVVQLRRGARGRPCGRGHGPLLQITLDATLFRVGAGHARDREVGRVSYRCGVSPGAGREVAAMGRSYKSGHGTVFGAGRGLGVTKRFSW